ncbi:hypothetical protein [Paenibacillus campinasensis]|nr:hypothetical protein [Paenibacillus campinasensis]
MSVKTGIELSYWMQCPIWSLGEWKAAINEVAKEIESDRKGG